MKIIGWTNFDSDCQGVCVEDKEEMLSALNETLRVIVENGYIFSGSTHQTGYCCVPVFDNGKCLRCSMRGWATLMSIAHTGDNQSYMDYYMDVVEEKVPEQQASSSDFITGENVEGVPYYYVNQDLEIAAQAAQAGIPLMTFDKVVNALYDIFKAYFDNN